MNCGGAETLIMNIYRKLDRSKVQFDFVVSVQERGHFDTEIEELGGRIFRLSQPSESFLSFSKALNNIFKWNGPFQAVHSHVHYFSGVIVTIAKNNRIPIRVSHSHSTKDGKNNRFLRRAYRSFMGVMMNRNSTHLLGCSNEACLSLFEMEANLEGKVQTFSNSIDLDRFHPSRLNGTLRAELNLKEDSLIIGHVGRFSEEKNHTHVIEVFEDLQRMNPNTHLVLVGEGERKPQIEEIVKNKMLYSNVHFLGLREDIPSIMSEFNVFLFPSLYEGLSLALIEAQAAGAKCVVSSNISKETAVIQNLMTFVPLDAPVSAWTTALNEALQQSFPISYHERLQILNNSGYNIHNSMQQLEQIYGLHY